MSRPVRLVVCINQRLGAGQRSCGGSGSLELIEKIKAMICSAGLDVPVVRRECLNRCQEGPVMRIAPAGPFFTEIDESALAGILAELESFVASHVE